MRSLVSELPNGTNETIAMKDAYFAFSHSQTLREAHLVESRSISNLSLRPWTLENLDAMKFKERLLLTIEFTDLPASIDTPLVEQFLAGFRDNQ